ncbi:MAG: transcription elongation factor 1 family protein [Candidatus Bathyarchaeia archaeon]
MKGVILGRRRRRVVKIVRRRLPKVFDCPMCGENSIKISVNKGSGKALIQCGVCGLREELEASRHLEPIDVYCLFTDNFYSRVKSASPASR